MYWSRHRGAGRTDACHLHHFSLHQTLPHLIECQLHFLFNCAPFTLTHCDFSKAAESDPVTEFIEIELRGNSALKVHFAVVSSGTTSGNEKKVEQGICDSLTNHIYVTGHLY